MIGNKREPAADGGKAPARRFVEDIAWIRGELLPMDALARPVLGIKSWDDAVCTRLGEERILASIDGPYTKRLVLKSALVHAATDVVVKGGRPVFALDALVGGKEDVAEMVGSLKEQALYMRIPLLGGNTLFEDTEARASIAVFGRLVVGEPIRDSTAKKGDVIALFGEPLWGDREDRLTKAKKMFDCWFRVLDAGVRINAAKDVTKGGLVSAVYEMEKKSGRKFRLNKSLPYPASRNLDNFMITADEKEIEKIKKHCVKHGVKLETIGVVE